MTVLEVQRPDEVVTAGVSVLARLGAGDDPGRPGVDYPADAGPVVLAALLTDGAAGAADTAARAATSRWLTGLRTGCARGGLFGWGLAGCYLGLRVLAEARPELSRAVTTTRAALLRQCQRAPWRRRDVTWPDYDLILGPAGMLLALAGDPEVSRADLAPVARHLAALCDRADLDRLRVSRSPDDRLAGWSLGRVNVGLGHGIPGLALALCAFVDRWGASAADDTAQAVVASRRVADWLVTRARTDEHGMMGWHPAGPARGTLARGVAEPSPPGSPTHMQAWCYGTPGIAWSLCELGRVLDDPELSRLGVAAFRSFLAAGGVSVNASVREGLTICHGDAGILVLCDAFARHAGLAEAGYHRDLLDRRLRADLAGFEQWATVDPSLLTGPVGVLAALLTLRGGDRTWLAMMGVR